MKKPPAKSAPLLCFECGTTFLRTIIGDGIVEYTFDRDPDGRISSESRAKIVTAIRELFQVSSWSLRPSAWCAISARGVSLRRISLPSVKGPLDQLIKLQIENEFPLPPDELAWGYLALPMFSKPGDSASQQEVLLGAVKKEQVQDFHDLLTACDVTPMFTLGALTRASLCVNPPDDFAILDLGSSQSELTVFEQNQPTLVRIISWNLGSSDQSFDELTAKLRSHWSGSTLYTFNHAEVAGRWASRLQKRESATAFEVIPHASNASALHGLRKTALSVGSGSPHLVLRIKPARLARNFLQPFLTTWGLRTAILLVAILIFPYLEAILFAPIVGAQVNDFKNRAELVENTVGREYEFLQYLKQNQPPYLETIYIFAQAAPPGTKLTSLNMNRQGEISVRCSMNNGEQAADFRSKLIKSGFFTLVTIDEQIPTPDRQRVNLRLSLQWKPIGQIPKPILPHPNQVATERESNP